MAGHSIYIDCAENMAELMATYPSELTDGVDLHMGDPSPEEISEIMSGYTGVLNGHPVMPKPLLEAHVEILRSVVFLGTGVANYVDPAAGAWKPVPDMETKRYGARAAVLDGKLWGAGGERFTNGHGAKTVEVFDPVSNTWDRSKADMIFARHFHAFAVLDGALHAVGGKAERYDPRADCWRIVPGMKPPEGRADFVAAVRYD